MSSLSLSTPSMVRRFRRVGAVLLLALIVPTIDILAGVLVAPTVVFMSNKNRTGRLTIQNPGDKPEEVSVHFSFGIPVTDSMGNVHVALQDSLVTDPNSCLDWVRAFPRRLILPPGASQVIRFVASPPSALDEGEYWSRVVVKSQEAETGAQPALEEGEITTKLNMVMQTAIMLKYRNGDLFSEVDLANTDITDRGDSLEIMMDLVSKGSASYVGLLYGRVFDAEDRLVGQVRYHIAVYRNLRRLMTVPIDPEMNFKRPFRVEVEVTSKGRTDIAAEDMIFGNDINYSMTLE